MIDAGAKRTNTTGRLHGSYPASIVSTEHPMGLHLAKVALVGLWDGLDPDVLPWAEFILPLGARPNAGHKVPVEEDDLVWVDFPRNGDTRYPRITGACYHAPEGISNLPTESTPEPDEEIVYEQIRHELEPLPPEYSVLDDIYQRFGFMVHKTHTGGYCLTHRASGSAIEMTDEGEIVIHAENNAYRSTTNDLIEHVGENLNITVMGNADIDVEGSLNVSSGGAAVVSTDSDATIDAAGNAIVQSGGDATVDASGQATVKSGSALSLDAGAALNIKASSGINIDAGGVFSVNASLADFKLG
ncbi:hypothetical protein [Thaumasiovibrio sp. DFM-14]|uniref:hypothetical protein n=1 Tax=Thaumasiovibrio sp. DFM-14 TaxID=3384792 RepID=UPI0039A238E7